MTPFRAIAALLALVTLTACGADGVPERPEPRQSGGVAAPVAAPSA